MIIIFLDSLTDFRRDTTLEAGMDMGWTSQQELQQYINAHLTLLTNAATHLVNRPRYRKRPVYAQIRLLPGRVLYHIRSPNKSNLRYLMKLFENATPVNMTTSDQTDSLIFCLTGLSSLQQAETIIPAQEAKDIMLVTTFTTTMGIITKARTNPTDIESEPVDSVTEVFGGPRPPLEGNSHLSLVH